MADLVRQTSISEKEKSSFIVTPLYPGNTRVYVSVYSCTQNLRDTQDFWKQTIHVEFHNDCL